MIDLVAMLLVGLLFGGALGAFLALRLGRPGALSRSAAGHAPVGETLERLDVRLRELELARAGAYGALTQQVSMTREATEALAGRTGELLTALRAPQTRGRWGELQLRRVVELAGMAPHCDFDEQVSTTTADGAVRPDLVVRLTGGRTVVVDAKVSLAAYLEASTETEEGR